MTLTLIGLRRARRAFFFRTR